MGPKKVKTRHSSGSCFGASASLPDTGNLFTVRDVLAAFAREVELAPLATTNFIATQLDVKIRDKWKEGNPDLVLMDQKSVVKRISRLHESAVQINRRSLSKARTDNFLEKLDRLFDMLVCQCQFISCTESRCDQAGCTGVHLQCFCPREEKIPEIEWEFAKDQREKIGHRGLMQMGAPDIPEAKRQEDLKAIKDRKKKNLEIAAEQPKGGKADVDTNVDMENNSQIDEDVNDEDFVVKKSGREGTHNQNRNKIDNFISELERYGISDRAGAALLNAHNRDLGIIIDGKDKDAVDKFKIRRSRAAHRRR